MGREEIARLFRVDAVVVGKWEKEGKITVIGEEDVTNTGGGTKRKIYEPLQVFHLLLELTGRPARLKLSEAEIAARAFQMFKDGATLEDCVIKLQVVPKVVRELYSEWRRALGEKPPVDLEAIQRRSEEKHEAMMKELDEEDRRRAEASSARRRRAIEEINGTNGRGRR